MLYSVSDLEETVILAADGAVGRVDALLFDDVSWVVRYIIVDPSNWLPGRRVLISPISIEALKIFEWVQLRLTKNQIRNSPDIDLNRPISRQTEIVFHGYYGYTPYWGGSGIWGHALYPGALALPPTQCDGNAPDARQPRGAHVAQVDPHLRSTREVRSYHVEASDGNVGRIDDFLLDAQSWSVWRLVAETTIGRARHRVLVSPVDVRRIAWTTTTLHVDLTCDEVCRSPEFKAAEMLPRRAPVVRPMTGSAGDDACAPSKTIENSARPSASVANYGTHRRG